MIPGEHCCSLPIGVQHCHSAGIAADSTTGVYLYASALQRLAQCLTGGSGKTLNTFLQRRIIHSQASRGYTLTLQAAYMPSGCHCPQKKLGGDAAAVQAYTSQMSVFHQSHFSAGPGKYTGSLAATGPATNDDNVKLIHICPLLQ